MIDSRAFEFMLYWKVSGTFAFYWGNSCQSCLQYLLLLYVFLGCEILTKKKKSSKQFKRIIVFNLLNHSKAKRPAIGLKVTDSIFYVTQKLVYCEGVRLSDFLHVFKALRLLLPKTSMFCKHHPLKNTQKNVYIKTHVKWGERKL